MVYRPKIDEKLCFVLMPFKPPFDGYYEAVVKPAIRDADLAPLRADEIYGTQPIIQDIWESIWKARVVVADVTGRNPNVNYELGLCHSLGVPTIIITKNFDDVPFDYRHRRCIGYKTDEAGWDGKLRSKLTSTIKAVLSAGSAGELSWPYDTTVLGEGVGATALIASGDARKVVIRGAMIARDAIGKAYGPHGEQVAISTSFGGTRSYQRGAQIIQGIKSNNPLEERGIEEVRRACADVSNSAGDCTKLVAVLCAEFMLKGQELIESGLHAKDVIEALDRSLEWALTYIGTQSRPVAGTDITQVATTAAAGDKRIGTLVSEALKKAGRYGIVSVATSDKTETELEFSEGIRFSQGYLSEYFVTNSETGESVLEDCVILLHERKISSMKDLLPILEQVAKSGKGLLVIAEDIEGEALATLTVNHVKGTLKCVPVRAPGIGHRRKELLEDIAILTGGKAFTEDLGVPLSNIQFSNLGRAEKVAVNGDSTSIIGGAGSSDSISDRIRGVKNKIDDAPNDNEREKLQERLAMLGGRVVTLRAGGFTEADVNIERYKLESALHAVHSAIEGGWILGGGLCLVRAAAALKQRKSSSEIELSVFSAIAGVLEEPLRQLIINAKSSPTKILTEVEKATTPEVGFNARLLLEFWIPRTAWPWLLGLPSPMLVRFCRRGRGI